MRCRLNAMGVAAAIALLIPLDGFGQGQRLYKWVDEDGNVHYSDRIEGQVDNRAPQRINAAGIQLGQQHSALPRSRQEERQREDERRQARADAALLATYRSEIELLRAHDETRANLEGSIRTAEANVNQLQRALSDRQGRQDSAARVDQLQRELATERRRLEQLLERRFELHERQNAEVNRYRELTIENEDG